MRLWLVIVTAVPWSVPSSAAQQHTARPGFSTLATVEVYTQTVLPSMLCRS